MFEDGLRVCCTAGKWRGRRVAVEESGRKGQKERWQQKLIELWSMGKHPVTWLSLGNGS